MTLDNQVIFLCNGCATSILQLQKKIDAETGSFKRALNLD